MGEELKRQDMEREEALSLFKEQLDAQFRDSIAELKVAPMCYTCRAGRTHFVCECRDVRLSWNGNETCSVLI